MKPQREGGGNNLYGSDLVEALTTLNDEELCAYILMEKIKSPTQTAITIRDGKEEEIKSICELGVFGVYLSVPEGTDNKWNDYCYNTSSGYILRVKSVEIDEGGVATGYSVLSAPRLV